ncbi:hypothetical protein GCM10027445_23510 [Amycolatopsis endophytica]|uniref:DUF3558 domain-containing protein n=1 Tax=Amycolatopsis endophytica TaxID=860233 RepID=A0A853BFU3_9PSEU|nr:DUF3558 domain-containing protein [Amycolatopsis endophytica]NYI93615.1 hypothetical protein [Amycolatopsis endophytica]
MRALAGVAYLILTLTACTSTVAGTPSPVVTSSPASTDVFAGLQACQVLEQLTAGEGFGPGENISKRNECDVLKPEYGSYGLALDPVQGLSEFAAANTGVVDISVNGRDAMRASFSSTGCSVAVEVAEHARAMVTVTMSRTSDAAQACPDAQALAEKLEPLLPEVQ